MDGSGKEKAEGTTLALYRGEIHPCPYLPDRAARSEGLAVSRMDGEIYRQLMDMGFRRSGRFVYRTACENCRACVPLRVPVDGFLASRSQRRVLRRNRDVEVEIGRPACTDEKWRVYVDYLRYQHDGTMSEDRDDFEAFLYADVTDTLEMVYRIKGRIAGVGIVDACPGCLSSVYYYFDPADARRSLGVFGVLREIEECRRQGLAYWYAGYYVCECDRMNYKADYRPYELLGEDGVWRA